MFHTLRSSARLLAGAAATTAAAAAAAGLTFASSPAPSLCHGGHSQPSAAAVTSELVALSERLAALEAAAATAAGRHGVATTTGQGGAVFSWEERLTACFPVRHRPEGRRGLAGPLLSVLDPRATGNAMPPFISCLVCCDTHVHQATLSSFALLPARSPLSSLSSPLHRKGAAPSSRTCTADSTRTVRLLPPQ